VTKLDRIETMPANTETLPEVKFWAELENELLHIESQLKLPEAGKLTCALKSLMSSSTSVCFRHAR
jgi:hypothetical protein